MSDAVEVAIVGAGPYGLSLGAHLRKAGVSVRQFGKPMQLWRDFMPEGMFLKSQGFASNLSDPDHTHTLEAFCKKTGRPYAHYGLPVALDTFVAYGQWFREALVPDIDEVLVTDIAKAGDGFEVTLANSEQVRARKVVVAIGVEAFSYVPEPLSALPSSVCTHAKDHTDLSVFSGQDVIVVGAGQSALETAALAELRARRPDRVLETNVEFWAAIVLDFAQIPAEITPSMFTCARTAGWAAHVLEQKLTGRLIRPSARYVGPAPRPVGEIPDAAEILRH